MNEQVARDVVLVRAIETTDRKKEILSDDDRQCLERILTQLTDRAGEMLDTARQTTRK